MKKILLAFALAGCVASTARADLIFSESFTYPDGGIVTNTPLWVNNSGTANSMLVSNNTLLVTSARSEDIAHQFSPKIMTNGPAGEVYASMKVIWTALPTQSGTYFTHFTGDSITYFRARVNAATTNYSMVSVAPAGSFYVGIGNNSPSGGTPLPPASGQWQTPLTTNVAYTLVSRYNLTTFQSTLWVDPADSSSPSVTADDYVDPTNAVNITYFGFRQASGEGSMIIDDLKVGTSFNDVAGANTAPAVSSIPNQSIPANATLGPVSFTISDSESAASTLTVGAASSNPDLVPNDATHLVLGGSDSDRTLTVTPLANAQGTTTITITVGDGVNTSTTSFLLSVGTPTVSAIPSQIGAVNAAVPPIAFTVSDPENDALSFSAASSNPGLLTSANITVGGTGSSRTITLVPEAGVGGITTVTLFVSDGFTTNSTKFTLTMRPLLGVVFDEPFNYQSFTIPNSLYLASGSPWQTIPPGTAFQLQTTNGFAYLTYTNTEDLGANLTGAPFYGTNGVVLYTGFTVNFSDLPSTSGNYFLMLKLNDADTQSFHARVFARTANAQSGNFRLGIANFSAGESAQFPMDLSLNTTYNVVVRYNCGSGETVLWINPANEQSSRVIANDNPGGSTIGGIGLREDAGIGSLALGHIKVGTSFSDVFTAPPAPTPEPITVQIVGGTIQLNWTQSTFSLEAADTVNGNYTRVPGASSPYTVPKESNSKFYRLAYP